MKTLTLTVITQRASSLNYGENIGNISVLKKLTLADNTQLTYVSDKALKYEIRRQGKERFGWNLLDEKLKEHLEGAISEGVLDVDKFAKSLIRDYEEFDLFGGLFTALSKDKKKLNLSYGDAVKRTTPVKLSYAFSVSPFKSDMDFMNNIDAYNRYIRHIEERGEQAIVNSEQHTSHYIYTLAVDLERVGVWEREDGKKEEVLEAHEKAKRIVELLEVIKTLSRQIRGRWENLSPVFVIGGVFSVKNPFFMDCVKAQEVEGKLYLKVDSLIDCMRLLPEGEEVLCGLLSGFFTNEEEIKEKLKAKSVAEVFEELKKKMAQAYGVG
jgi:CRISPR-associated protein Cst2